MATRDGESDMEDMNPGTKYIVERSRPEPASLADAFRSQIVAGRNLTNRETNGQREE